MPGHRHARKDDALDRLGDGIARLTSSDAWRAYLRVQARFHTYSFSNTVLIQLQRPSATRVAGFGTWLKLGRHVRRGEQAIWILAPVTRRVASDDEEQEGAPVVTAFRPVAVFDIAQTDGEPLPEVCTRLAGDDPRGLSAALVAVAHDLGFGVEDHASDDGTNGDCAHALRRIRLRSDLAPAHRVKTLAHELAHALLHAEPGDRPLMELEAESVAFVVCDALGIDAGAWSFGYVATWSGGGEAAIAAIKGAGARIQRAAHRILSELEVGRDNVPDPPTRDGS
jgi:N-terminal domain of anti-restriction factor ArdC/IrrE N-terminal-like domain